ncbi:F-box domain-containing protein [Mycena indigotica]|uniref:F-box domain-containing protein n=1 Tax=Mycena indigotica TaxID=2126181 RepID=A0A8H6T4V2_9AGAR|nr:F-box domain-containing protein [Mycena indigotica]KAF7311773.1 F-box domain-containing protein [Mycena indigotica]
MSSVEDLPPDILLVLMGYLDAQDLLRLLSTCRRIHALADERSIWLAAIAHLELVQHQPVTSFQDDLTVLSTQDLQFLVRRAAGILCNLDSPHPQLAEIAAFNLEDFSEAVFIPGTGLLLMSGFQQLAVWDVFARRCVATVDVEKGEPQGAQLTVFVAPCVWVGARALFSGGLTRRAAQGELLVDKLAAIYVDVEDRENIQVDILYSSPVQRIRRSHWPEHFISAALMGFSTEDGEIVWWDFAADEVHRQRYMFPMNQMGRGATSGLFYDSLTKRLHGFAPYDFENEAGLHSAQLGSIRGHHAPLESQAIPVRFPTAESLAQLTAIARLYLSSSIPPSMVGSYAKFGVFAVTYGTFRRIGQPEPDDRRFLHFFRGPSSGLPMVGQAIESLPYQFPPFLTPVFGVGSTGSVFIRGFVQPKAPPGTRPLVGVLRLRRGAQQPALTCFHGENLTASGPIAHDEIVGLASIWDHRTRVIRVFSYAGNKH